MKAIVCEMCSSNNVVKTDGFFVCQNCGTKYSIEEAKKLFVEIDNSKELENSLVIARRALKNSDWASAQAAYERILLSNPMNWEAFFYLAYCKAWQCRLVDICDAVDSVNNTTKEIVNILSQSGEDDNEKICKLITSDLYRLTDVLLENACRKYQDLITSSDSDYKARMLKSVMATPTVLLYWQLIISELCNNKQLIIDVSKKAGAQLIKANRALYNTNTMDPFLYKNLSNCEKLIHLNGEPNFSFNVKPANHSLTPVGTTGCYVATCVYGSYDCPQVWTLRRYRDYTLAETWYGRAFIHTYYAISPTLVKWFGHTNWFKRMWRGKLDRMVGKLNSKGVMDTPYEDRRW